MLFTSPFFLFIFLPLILLFYQISPKKTKNVLLLFSSLFFYAWGEKVLVLLLILSAIVDFTCGLIIDKGQRKAGLIISLIFNIGILVYFKYAHFAFTNLRNLLEFFNFTDINLNHFGDIVLPLGISFYTFQTMSYTIDVYRGSVKANKNFIDFATYVTLFPQLVAGPIVRYKEIAKELKNRHVNLTLFYTGIERFIIGLSKKIIVANNCAFLADGIFAMHPNETSALMAWLGLIAYSLQIYFDFSGYSDMAIGLGKMLGFNFPENFNYPYISKSIREFWRRWHITLSNWFRDYVYISLGGNREGLLRTYLNLIIVFSVTGLWHGANWTFVIWGLWHGSFIIIERLGLKKILAQLPNVYSHVYLLLVVMIGWVFFRSSSISLGFLYIKAMFDFSTITNYEYLSFFLEKETLIMLLIGISFSFPWSNYLTIAKLGTYKQYIKGGLTIILLIVNYVYIATDSYNPFIYFRF